MDERLNAEVDLNDRVGGLYYFVFARAWPAGRPTVPILPTGSTRIYNASLGWSLDAIGAPPLAPPAVTDADIAAIPAGLYYVWLDLAEYKAIGVGLGNYIQTNESAQDRSQSWGTLRQQFQARQSELEKLYAPYIKASRFALDYGTIRLPIQNRPGDEFTYAGW